MNFLPVPRMSLHPRLCKDDVRQALPGKEPKYLLLFGDASYDFKSRTQNNTNFVPLMNPMNPCTGPIRSFPMIISGCLIPMKDSLPMAACDIGVADFGRLHLTGQGSSRIK